jgi:hypothetical protein
LKYRSDLIRTVKRLIVLKRCVASAEAWITVSKRRDNQRWYRIVLSGNADGQAGTYPAIRLNGLRELNDGALLTVSAVVGKDGGVVEYTAGLSGILKKSKASWFARIDFDHEPRGQGPCGHPNLHCHIEADPNSSFQPRVPLPWLTPAEAWEWLLATVDPDMEPPAVAPR